MGEIFLKLLNMSITAGWLILAVLCVRLLFRKIPKWVNCLLWGVVAIRLIFPFSIESAFSLQPSAQPIQSSTMVGGEVLPYIPSVDSQLSIFENTVNPILAETFAYQESESVAPLQVITEIAGMVWLFGMIILLVFAIVSMIRLHLLVRESVWYKDNVYICDAVKSPFILGIIRPRIYLSSALSEEEIEYIMAHETAHLKRKDHLWKPFGYLLLSVYWFQPLCWIAYIMLCKDIELACDEKVIKDMSFEDKKEYSRVLLSCAAQRRLVMTCPLAFGEVGVKERVKTVLNYKKPVFWITIAAIVVCVIIAICFLTNPAKDAEVRISENPSTEEMGEWVKEEINLEKRDVTHDGVSDYIVTSMEYDPAYMEEDSTLQERIAQQIKYDVVAVKVYEGKKDSNTYSEENLLWSQEYSGAHVGNGQISIVQMDDKDYLLTSSLYGGQGLAAWNYEVFSLNGTGEKEIIDKQSVEFDMAAENSAESHKEFQSSLNKYINNGILIVACDIDVEEQMIRTQESPYIPQDYYNHALTKFDNTENGSEAQNPDPDANDELKVIVTNISTGESKELLAEDGLALSDILASDSWNTEATTDCIDDCEIIINGATYKYHSECGTFNDNANQRYLSLDNKTQHLVNTTLEKYISLTAEKPIELPAE